jgi:hypothetical protein
VKRKEQENMGSAANQDDLKAVIAFARAVHKAVPLVSPKQAADAFNRLISEPSPADIFGGAVVRKELTDLWLDARIARERYMTALAEAVIRSSPIINPDKVDPDLYKNAERDAA